jgi:DNA primase
MDVVEEIKQRLDLAEVVGGTVRLQKAGRNLKGLCPFHSEKTPSFFVFPDSQNWHCFGCGKGGDVFSFVMEMQGWDFRTALEDLGRRAGVEVRPLTPAQQEAVAEADRLRAAMEEAADYYHRLLKSAPQAQGAREYLKRRGFKAETVDEFRLGYGLRSWDALRTHLLGKGFTLEELVKAGLLVQREDGRTYDRFRDRVMIPIFDRRGRIVAFGGRVLHPDDQPKYMNSPQTPLFDKSKVLYGLHRASRALRDADAAIIVEGYMDVMIPWQEGYENVVAPMGTALTETHLKQLQRLTRRFILALDPDYAGITATLRGLETARETLDRDLEAVFDARGLVGYEGRLDADIRVLLLPDGLDPDELILEDRERWEKLLEEAQPVVRFYFDQLLQQENPEEPKGKARIVDAMLPLLRDIASTVEREAYAQEIAVRLGLDPRLLLDRLRVQDRVEAMRRQAAVAAPQRSRRPSDKESHALSILLHHPDLMQQVDMELVQLDLPPLRDEDFALGRRLIWVAWLEVRADPTLELEELLPPDLYAEVEEWMAHPLPDVPLEERKRTLLRTVLQMRERRVRENHQELQDLVREAQRQGDLKPVEYFSHLNELTQTLLCIQGALWPKGQ